MAYNLDPQRDEMLKRIAATMQQREMSPFAPQGGRSPRQAAVQAAMQPAPQPMQVDPAAQAVKAKAKPAPSITDSISNFTAGIGTDVPDGGAPGTDVPDQAPAGAPSDLGDPGEDQTAKTASNAVSRGAAGAAAGGPAGAAIGAGSALLEGALNARAAAKRQARAAALKGLQTQARAGETLASGTASAVQDIIAGIARSVRA
jgi:hypothetical protein